MYIIQYVVINVIGNIHSSKYIDALIIWYFMPEIRPLFNTINPRTVIISEAKRILLQRIYILFLSHLGTVIHLVTTIGRYKAEVFKLLDSLGDIGEILFLSHT